MKKIGKTLDEKRVEDMAICREIVQEVLNFGVSDAQKERIIYLLSLELESREKMVKISKIIKDEENDSEESKGLLQV